MARWIKTDGTEQEVKSQGSQYFTNTVLHALVEKPKGEDDEQDA